VLVSLMVHAPSNSCARSAPTHKNRKPTPERDWMYFQATASLRTRMAVNLSQRKHSG
jgi:hypothetical protein